MRQHKQLLAQIVFFGFVGVVSLLIDVGVTSFLFNVLNFSAFFASAVGFVSAFFFNFPMNRKKVFRHSAADRFNFHTQVTMYVALSVFNLVATSLMVEVLVTFHILTIGYAKLLVTAIIAAWNFALFKWVIFSKRAI